MKVLTLDDSFHKNARILGYGGFVVDEAELRNVELGVRAVKAKHGVPQDVELKWSPRPNHFLRSKAFEGKRPELYRDTLAILNDTEATVLCGVHYLEDCYGRKDHGWSVAKTKEWAAKKQLAYLAERFQRPVLSSSDGTGIIIADEYESRKGEQALIEYFRATMLEGTQFEQLDRIAVPVLTAPSTHSSHIQVADIVAGVVVGHLGGNPYAAEQFEPVALRCLRNPREGVTVFDSSLSEEVLGFGIKVFPGDSEPKATEQFSELDERYRVNQHGIYVPQQQLQANDDDLPF